MYLIEGIFNEFQECERCGEVFHTDLIHVNGLCETCNDDMNS